MERRVENWRKSAGRGEVWDASSGIRALLSVFGNVSNGEIVR